MSKSKLTLSIEEDILRSAKQVAAEKGISVSRLVENYLSFFTNPKVNCFSCGEEFHIKDTDECPSCGWFKCQFCRTCRCDLKDEVATALFHMRKVYEYLLAGRVE